MTQQDLFENIGEHLKERGIDRVAESCIGWVENAAIEIIHVAGERGTVTADDIRHLPNPPHPNAIGAAFHKAAKTGVIVQDGYQKSRHPTCHGRVISVWRLSSQCSSRDRLDSSPAPSIRRQKTPSQASSSRIQGQNRAKDGTVEAVGCKRRSGDTPKAAFSPVLETSSAKNGGDTAASRSQAACSRS